MPSNEQEARNIVVNGHRTSMRLEAEFWEALEEICAREGVTINQICNRVVRNRGEASLTAAMRVYIIAYFREASPPSDRD